MPRGQKQKLHRGENAFRKEGDLHQGKEVVVTDEGDPYGGRSSARLRGRNTGPLSGSCLPLINGDSHARKM